MTEVTLPGCRTTPLGGYLAALGLLRAVARLLDSEVSGRWERQRFVLASRFATLDALVDEVVERFEPEAIVSPWNAGSGFAGNGKNVTPSGPCRQSGTPTSLGWRACATRSPLVNALWPSAGNGAGRQGRRSVGQVPQAGGPRAVPQRVP